MELDPDLLGTIFGAGLVAVIIGAVIYLGIIALSIWVTYLIIRTAVKNGILKADEERAARGALAASQQRHPPGYGAPY